MHSCNWLETIARPRLHASIALHAVDKHHTLQTGHRPHLQWAGGYSLPILHSHHGRYLHMLFSVNLHSVMDNLKHFSFVGGGASPDQEICPWTPLSAPIWPMRHYPLALAMVQRTLRQILVSASKTFNYKSLYIGLYIAVGYYCCKETCTYSQMLWSRGDQGSDRPVP